jgi:hypothetical protein
VRRGALVGNDWDERPQPRQYFIQAAADMISRCCLGDFLIPLRQSALESLS